MRSNSLYVTGTASSSPAPVRSRGGAGSAGDRPGAGDPVVGRQRRRFHATCRIRGRRLCQLRAQGCAKLARQENFDTRHTARNASQTRYTAAGPRHNNPLPALRCRWPVPSARSSSRRWPLARYGPRVPLVGHVRSAQLSQTAGLGKV